MRFGLLIYASAPGAQAPRTALRFANAALAAGHQIQQVFFYGDGVHNLNALARPGADEFDASAEWATLGKAHGIELVSCSASGQRRGILDATEAKRFDHAGPSLSAAAESAGLGALVEACLQCDRVVTFA